MRVEERKKLMGLVTRWRKAASVDERVGRASLAVGLVCIERSMAADLERVLTAMPAEEPAEYQLGHCSHCSVDGSQCCALGVNVHDVIETIAALRASELDTLGLPKAPA